MSATESIKKSANDLQTELESLVKEKFNLKMQHSTQQLQKSHLLKQVRRNIARVKTLLNDLNGNLGANHE